MGISMSRKLPLGIQSFEKIRENNNVYVDKTEYIYRLVHTDVPYFLSRPRRFGKSLLLSTMKAYWEGRQDLFSGLKIEELEQSNPDAWNAYPVFYFDFNGKNYQSTPALEAALDVQLKEWEEKYGISAADGLEERFKRLLRTACEQSGRRCVVLVDEYDKPLLETAWNSELVEHNKAVFKGFFSTLKSHDAYIRFVFITGVTKFSKVSIFSDLNQLHDISMSREFAEICGITESELTSNFSSEISDMAAEQEMTEEQCISRLKQTYDGYHFHEKSPGVYNPFSLLSALTDREFGAYWYETGTPTFLAKRLKEMQFDVRKFTDGTLYASKRSLRDYSGDNPDPVPLLYQTGYLTITDADDGACTLAFPNNEVKYGFLESLLPEYAEGVGAGSGKDYLTLSKYAQSGDIEGMHKVFSSLFASIPYTTNDTPFEHDFQTVFYIIFQLLGQRVHCEYHTYTGRIDCIVETERYVYIFEFKRDDSADAALAQISDRDYAAPFAADPRTVYLIGVNLSSDTRQIDGWEYYEYR